MKKYFENLAKALLGQTYGDLTTGQQKVIESIAEQTSGLRSLRAKATFEVNLKLELELELMRLHEKVDQLESEPTSHEICIDSVNSDWHVL